MASSDSTSGDFKADDKDTIDSPAESDEAVLEKAITPLTPPPPVEDGGARAWLQVLVRIFA